MPRTVAFREALNEAMLEEPAAFFAACRAWGLTVVSLPTAYWHTLAAGLTDEVVRPAALRLLIIGGEAVNPVRLAEWCELDTGRIRLLNTYGCTETTLITHAVDLHGPRAPRFDRPWAASRRSWNRCAVRSRA